MNMFPNHLRRQLEYCIARMLYLTCFEYSILIFFSKTLFVYLPTQKSIDSNFFFFATDCLSIIVYCNLMNTLLQSVIVCSPIQHSSCFIENWYHIHQFDPTICHAISFQMSYPKHNPFPCINLFCLLD